VVNGFVTPSFSTCTTSDGSFTGYHLIGPAACSVDEKTNIPRLFANGGPEGASCVIADAPGTGGGSCLGDPDGDGQEEEVLYFDNACLSNIGTSPTATLYELMMRVPDMPTKILLPISGLQLLCDQE